MKTFTRRTFIKKASTTCAGCCALMASPSLLAFNGGVLKGEKPDPEKLNYCGYTCPDECEFKKASVANDNKLKKEAFAAWKLEERYGIKFEAEKTYCYGCKNDDKPEGVVLTNCTVRKCVIEKNYNCCIECDQLTSCNKELWTMFPKFYEQVKELQRTYLAS
ncbi:MAG: DUF3795 domain-containing protein [Bacteroidales bacterium]|nr:DUF3795 domain-containing protein [Bacteroidales bacterium]MCF8403617.1 DUF3795 domain-containing protein [Bacteroidales bacterium]